MSKPGRSLLVASLVVVTTSAHADGAWLWWQEVQWKTPAGIRVTWDTPRAYASQAACATQLASEVQRLEAKYRAEESATLGQTATLLPGDLTAEILSVDPSHLERGQLTMRIYCLPETVDPRGPKGK